MLKNIVFQKEVLCSLRFHRNNKKWMFQAAKSGTLCPSPLTSVMKLGLTSKATSREGKVLQQLQPPCMVDQATDGETGQDRGGRQDKLTGRLRTSTYSPLSLLVLSAEFMMR